MKYVLRTRCRIELTTIPFEEESTPNYCVRSTDYNLVNKFVLFYYIFAAVTDAAVKIGPVRMPPMQETRYPMGPPALAFVQACVVVYAGTSC